MIKIPDATNNSGIIVQSVSFTGSFLTLLNLLPSQIYTLTANGDSLFVNMNGLNHDYLYLRCAQSKNEWSCIKDGSQLNMSDLLAVIPCHYGDFIYYEKNHVGGKNVLASTCVDTLDLVFTDKWGYPLAGMTDFLVELTIDFVCLGVKDYKISLDDIKKMM